LGHNDVDLSILNFSKIFSLKMFNISLTHSFTKAKTMIQ
jgi:hypothetical protein